jgi:hypothetical protein
MTWADIIQASFRCKRVNESSETLNEDPIRVFFTKFNKTQIERFKYQIFIYN